MKSVAKRGGSTKGSESETARLVTLALSGCGKTQVEVARDMGLENANVLSMYKQGAIRLPFARALALCESTGYNAEKLIFTMMEEYMPDAYETFGKLRGEALSEWERQLVSIAREAKNEVEMELEGPIEHSPSISIDVQKRRRKQLRITDDPKAIKKFKKAFVDHLLVE